MTKKTRYRQRLDAYDAQWTGAYSGWAMNFARQNEWRFGPDVGADDLFQEFAIKFLRVKEKYHGTITNDRHFMSLFQTACRNRVLDMVRKKFTTVSTVPIEAAAHSEDKVPSELVPDLFNYEEEAIFRAIVSTAPKVVQDICASALDGKGGYRKINGRWEIRSQLLSRLAGAAGDHTKALNSWLSNEFGISQKISLEDCDALRIGG